MSIAGMLPYEKTPIVSAIKALYGVVRSIDEYVDGLIRDMKANTSSTISRTGRILEGAKYGFGLGYIVPVAIIAVGQYLLGNTLGALATLGGAMVLSNPIATTAAAIGAIYYGWQALTPSEKDDILEKLARGLEIGVELIRSLIRYVIEQANGLLSKSNFAEIKTFVEDSAHGVAKTFLEFGQAISDGASGAIDFVKGTLKKIPTPGASKPVRPRRLVVSKKKAADSGRPVIRRA